MSKTLHNPPSHRKILHFDLDAFFCAVEELLRPELKGKPFAVGGSASGRGVVTSCSYAARRRGVRSAMPMSRALSICPDLIAVRMKGNVREKSREVMDLLKENVTILQRVSVDEAFVDVTNSEENLYSIAKRIQFKINTETQLPCSIGGGTNKLIAKVANNVGKSSAITDDYPNAINIISPGSEKTFLHPLQVRELWGIGPKTAERLAVINIKTVGDLADIPIDDLFRRVGNSAYPLKSMAEGIDTREVSEVRGNRKSISQERTFRKDTRSEKELLETIERQAAKISNQMKKKKIYGGTVKLKIRDNHFNTITRQITLLHPTNNSEEIFFAAKQLLKENWHKHTSIRLVGTGVSNMQIPSKQLLLWDYPDNKKNILLDTMLEEMRDKFGDEIIRKGLKE